jgi:Arc/MetJ-type ribon-helix-helix transcriptional regulator
LPQNKVTIKIPKPLYDHIKTLIDESGFNSVTDFVVYVLRDIVYAEQKESRGQFSPDELEEIKNKLKSLGYL